MIRSIALAATAFLVGCHPVTAPRSASSVLEIARLEGSRGPGIPRLVALARRGDDLAIRALGRVGGKTARDALVALLPDPRAATALGIACALDEPDAPVAAALGAALAGPTPAAPPTTETLEALGRCGDAASERHLVDAVVPPADAPVLPGTEEASALALGRFGRRKIALTASARNALGEASSNGDPAIRYAAVYALAREFHPPAAADDATTIAALKMRLGDQPEIAAIAASALARRADLGDPGDAAAVATLLHAADWRVVAEAARAGVDPKAAPIDVTAALATADAPHAILEALAGFAKLATDDATRARVPPEPRLADFTGVTDPLARGWIACRAGAIRALLAHQLAAFAAEPCTGLPAVYRDNVLGELAAEPTVDTADERAEAAIALLAKGDRRATLAALNIVGSLHGNALVRQLADLVASADPVIASGAIDAASSRTDLAAQPALVAALSARVATETAPDLLAQLYDAIAKGKLDTAPCKRGLALHPIAAAAAAKCLGVAPPADPPALAAPPAWIDPATAIGKHLRWHVVTTRGEIVIALRPDIAPWTVAMIVALTRKGFYDGLDFHRVVADFVVQGGDPTMTGAGGPGFVIPAEPGGAFATGGVGIADSGRDTGSSQWFIMHARAPHLDGRYTWFGVVERGQKSADALQIGDRVVHATIEEMR